MMGPIMSAMHSDVRTILRNNFDGCVRRVFHNEDPRKPVTSSTVFVEARQVFRNMVTHIMVDGRKNEARFVLTAPKVQLRLRSLLVPDFILARTKPTAVSCCGRTWVVFSLSPLCTRELRVSCRFQCFKHRVAAFRYLCSPASLSRIWSRILSHSKH